MNTESSICQIISRTPAKWIAHQNQVHPLRNTQNYEQKSTPFLWQDWTLKSSKGLQENYKNWRLFNAALCHHQVES